MKSSLSLLLLFVTNAYIPVGYSQELHHGVARAIPFTDTGISGDPVAVFSSSNRIYCLVKCKQFMCSSFNFGNRTCELYNTYLCQGVSTLVSKRGFRYFDVETEDFIPLADVYRNTRDCTDAGHCSPKCYTPTTTSPTATTTTLEPPGPGDVNYACSSDTDCTAANSDCRNGDICECQAGYSYLPSTRACVTSCPNGYGNTWHLTTGFYLHGYDDMEISGSSVTKENCQQQCEDTPACASIDFDTLLYICQLSSATKHGHEEEFREDSYYKYYQRNCA